jgi:hypothetical protein
LEGVIGSFNTRPFNGKIRTILLYFNNICCAISMCAQVTEQTFTLQCVNEVNKIIRYLKKTQYVQLRYPALDSRSLRLLVYADASFNNREGNRSQLGYPVLLSDATGRFSIITYKSDKSKRVTRSSFAGECFAFADGFDRGPILKHELERMTGNCIPLMLFTDSKTLFDVITRARYTTETRLMIDISASREAFNERLISNIGLIKSEFNPADSLTKIGSNGAMLTLLRSGKIEHPIEQIIIDK